MKRSVLVLLVSPLWLYLTNYLRGDDTPLWMAAIAAYVLIAWPTAVGIVYGEKRGRSCALKETGARHCDDFPK